MISNVGFTLNLLQAARTAKHTTFYSKCDTVSGLPNFTEAIRMLTILMEIGI